MELYDGQGRRISLGRVLGRGGEGSVHEVPSISPHLVAKVYHEAISPEKQAKLRAMVSRADERLRDIAAWPTQTLHPAVNGPVRGFLMPKAAQAEPLHHLYGPGQRKQQFPSADWAFLVNTARNVASAFATVHGAGCVIGDVNPNSVFVSRNTLTRLIDCDSFQIPNGRSPFLCEVGVPNFTPPELQGLPSFKNVQRTPNHDNFGLALLVFHLLMMGRHPFSGRYSGSGDMPQEKAIKEFRYAFSAPAGRRGMLPPPNTVGPEILPPTVAAMFEQAFTEGGAHASGRPTAQNWIAALDGLKHQLRTCGNEAVHKFHGGLSGCPWCELEQRAGIVFFIGFITGTSSSAASTPSFDIHRVWAAILAVPTPGTAAAPVFASPGNLTPKPLPADQRRTKSWRKIRRWSAVPVFVACVAIYPHLWFFAVILAGFLFFSGTSHLRERELRKSALDDAKRVASAAWSQWTNIATDKAFQDELAELKQTRTEFEELANRFANDKQRLHANARELQLRKHLERYFISNFDIPGIGPTRKSTLASFGIESAADVSWNRIRAIKGFGERLTRELVDWRKKMESRFVFDASKGIDPADVAALQQRYAQHKRQLEAQLSSGPERLKKARQKIEQQRSVIREMVLNASLRVAQAEIDFKAAE
ncbi:helix-hairpin-helix domain-containing protein [Cupriavidus sp. WS]|uniref:helix-hairpin-helix domain-containing protein n=1 Tax=Cupriavidus sp. WS TaxID=1312922 RepID=UPI00039DC238|nr:helix-hairpin-helix domain-containing protein [Cupriavidus sp. WS]